LGLHIKLYTFLLVTPLIKLRTIFFTRDKLQSSKDKRNKKEPKHQRKGSKLKAWVFTTVEDTILALCFYYGVLKAHTWGGFVVFLATTLLLSFVVMGFEYVSFQTFAPAGAPYPIKEGVDLSILPFQTALTALVYRYADHETSVGNNSVEDGDDSAPDFSFVHTFVCFFLTLLWTDLQFGLTHLLTHKVPRLWK